MVIYQKYVQGFRKQVNLVLPFHEPERLYSGPDWLVTSVSYGEYARQNLTTT